MAGALGAADLFKATLGGLYFSELRCLPEEPRPREPQGGDILQNFTSRASGQILQRAPLGQGPKALCLNPPGSGREIWAGSLGPGSVTASQCVDNSLVRGLVLSLCKTKGLAKGHADQTSPGTLWTCALKGDFWQPRHLLVWGGGWGWRSRPQGPGTCHSEQMPCLLPCGPLSSGLRGGGSQADPSPPPLDS